MKTLRMMVLLYTVALPAPTAAAAQITEDLVHAYLEAQVQERGIPGLTAAVVEGGEVVYAAAFGERRVGEGEPLTPDHVFHFASVSKPFVATAIVQLAEDEKVGLDDLVTEHLPYFELADPAYREITIRQMLNHTSGMPDVEDYEWDRPQYDAGAAERYVRSIGSQKMLWPPAGGFRYSNMAFDALGDVIAKISGVSFEEYIQQNILEPLAMDRSSFVHPDIEESLRTTDHVGDPPRVSEVYPYNRRHAPSSTLNSSVRQMTRWMLANLNRGELDGVRILRSDSYEHLWTPTTETGRNGDAVGLSWFISEHRGHRMLYHGGSDTGFRSYILLLPDDGIGIVLASNWSGTDTGALARGMLDVILDSQE